MSPPADSADAAPRVQSVDRAMRILFAVAQSKDGLKAADVVAATGLPRQACYHILHTLVTTGILTRSSAGKYVLGLRASTLVEGFRRHLAPPEYLAPVVRRIAPVRADGDRAEFDLDLLTGMAGFDRMLGADAPVVAVEGAQAEYRVR